MRDPERDGRMVVQHRHHFGLLLPRRALEEPRLIVSPVIDVRAGQREILKQQHPGLIRLAVEIGRQHVGDDAERIQVGCLGGHDVGREQLGGELVQSVRRRVARAAQKHRPSVDGKAPPAMPDVPGQLAKGKHVVDPRRFGAVPVTGDHLGAIHMLLPEPPGLPSLRARKRQAHGDRLFHSAAKPHLAPEPDRIATLGGHGELDLAVHLAAIEVAQARFHLEPAVSGFEGGTQPQPVDSDRAHVFELDRLPQAKGHLLPVVLRKARVSGRRIRLEVAVVEETHDVALLLRLGLDRGLAADHQQVLRLQVRGQVETKRREVAIVRAQQPAVEPHVGGEERAADAKHDAAGVIWARKLGAVPHRLASFGRGKLARHLDRFPPGAAPDRQTLRLAFAERHPDGLPSGELAPT